MKLFMLIKYNKIKNKSSINGMWLIYNKEKEKQNISYNNFQTDKNFSIDVNKLIFLN